MKPNIPQSMQSRSVLLKNMFNPEEWDTHRAITERILLTLDFKVKLNVTGTRNLQTTSRANVKPNMAPLSSSRSRRNPRSVVHLTFSLLSVNDDIPGRDLRQIWFHWVGKKCYTRFERSLVWWQPSFSRFHLGRYYASSSMINAARKTRSEGYSVVIPCWIFYLWQETYVISVVLKLSLRRRFSQNMPCYADSMMSVSGRFPDVLEEYA